ncbi:MAG: BrnA antitoxin family protein [Desulfovibrionaceae bacterium]|nr:BrnA antitoxin family protein [Desulfovibrionaceae bacterium]MBF0513507.1 BrnA antitoxin family protein [Desulfovibrionaceae bacterium]
MKRQPKTDLKVLDKLTDAEVTRRAKSDPDNLPLDREFFDIAKRIKLEDLMPEQKQQVTLRLDADVLVWFKRQGKGYQTRINAALRAFKEAANG